MKVTGNTIIITTPEDLLPLITEALTLAGFDKDASSTKDTDACGANRPKRRLLSPKDVEHEYA